MVKPNKVHDNNLWDEWVKNAESYFSILKPGAKVAFFVGESDKNFLLIEKLESDIKSNFKINGSLNMMDTDLFFTLTEEDTLEILEDYKKLPNFIKEGKLGIFCLIDDVMMEEKGIDKFLNSLGFAPSCSF